MKIAFISTRGIPNHYGGLEEFAEHVSVRLAEKGHEVIVYNPHFHPYDKEDFHGVRIVKKYSPENRIGTAANFIYDYLSLRDAIKRGCDKILVCGYTTAAISYYFLPVNKTTLYTNIDGMEWWRAKWSPIVQKLTKWFEEIALKKSHVLIADNIGIQEYLKNTHRLNSYFIPYAADINHVPDESVLRQFHLEKYNYNALIGRLEPENNIEMILDGCVASVSPVKTIIMASTKTKFAKYLVNKYKGNEKIVFKGWVGGQNTLGQVRYFANIYFHGHSVGGTNPSLLEAMAGGSLIAAHNNSFNKSVLGPDACYFSNAGEVASLLNEAASFTANRELFTKNNLHKMATIYTWKNITDQYEKMFAETCNPLLKK